MLWLLFIIFYVEPTSFHKAYIEVTLGNVECELVENERNETKWLCEPTD